MLCKTLGVMPEPVYCTKIASRLARTYTDKHGLKDLARELLGVDLSKQQQLSDWGADELTDAQVAYAADRCAASACAEGEARRMLAREGRAELAAACFRFLPDRVPGSTSPAGRPRIFFPIRRKLLYSGGYWLTTERLLPRRGHIRAACCGVGREMISGIFPR